tara:strand:- start:27 stop:905 length:879 start_codon:yes stop_codon:yes gene_type:complete
MKKNISLVFVFLLTLFFVNGFFINDSAFAEDDGTLGAWSATSPLNVERISSVVVAGDGFLYAMAGISDAGSGRDRLKSVEVAEINSNGTLGSWEETSFLSFPRVDGSGTVYNGYVYYVGGWNLGRGHLRDVEVAKIITEGDDKGKLETWKPTSSLNVARAHAGVVAYNGYLYAISGENGEWTSEYAEILDEGQLGPWQRTTPMNKGRREFAMVEYNGYLYAAGGYYDGNLLDSVERVKVKTDGSGELETWMPATPLPTARRWVSRMGVASNGFFYVLGGVSDSGVLMTYPKS